jgi:hypothetical protein
MRWIPGGKGRNKARTTADIFTVVTKDDPSRGHLTQFPLTRILPCFSHPFSPSPPTQSYLRPKQAAENSRMSVVLAIVTTFHWSGIGRVLGRDDIGKVALRRISGARSLGSKSLHSDSQPDIHQSAVRSKARESTWILPKGIKPLCWVLDMRLQDRQRASPKAQGCG